MKTLEVKVEKCAGECSWYKKRIGETFNVRNSTHPEWQGWYEVVEDIKGMTKMLRSGDVEIIKPHNR